MIANSDHCVLNAIVVMNKSNELKQGGVRGSLKLDVHHHFRKLGEHILQSGDLLLFGFNCAPVAKVEHNFVCEHGQLLVPVVLHVFVQPARPL